MGDKVKVHSFTTQTQLFLTPPHFFFFLAGDEGSDLSSLGRLILWVTTQTQLFLTPPPIFFSLAGERGVT